MKSKVAITQFLSMDELPDYWTNEDLKKLLEEFDFPDVDQVASSELKEMLLMAITDFEPSEAAEKILTYKLSGILTKGQIQQLSHEMLEDKVAEEYPDIALHYPLFNINQLLFKAFNGRFPNTKATIIKFTFTPLDPETEYTKAVALQALHTGLKEQNLLKRLYTSELKGASPFDDAEKIVWKLIHNNGHFELTTSDYWLNKEDFESINFEAQVKIFEHVEEDK